MVRKPTQSRHTQPHPSRRGHNMFRGSSSAPQQGCTNTRAPLIGLQLTISQAWGLSDRVWAVDEAKRTEQLT